METARQAPRRNDPATLAAALAAVWSLSAEGMEPEDNGLKLSRDVPARYRGEGLQYSPVLNRSRENTDLVASPGGEIRNKSFYTAGNAAHPRLSAVYSLPANGFWDSAMVRLDAGRLHLSGIGRGPLAGDPAANRKTRAVQFLFVPTWSEVLPSLDVSLPVTLSYSSKTQAPLPTMERNYRGGRFSIGASLVYEKTWTTDLRYMHYFEEPAAPSRDRNFLWLSIQRSF